MCATGMKGSNYLFFYKDERDFQLFNKFPQHDRFLEELKKGEENYLEFFKRALYENIDVLYNVRKKLLNGEYLYTGLRTWFNLCYYLKLKDESIEEKLDKFCFVKEEELQKFYIDLKGHDFTEEIRNMLSVLDGRLSFLEVDEELGKYLEFISWYPESKYCVFKGEF